MALPGLGKTVGASALEGRAREGGGAQPAEGKRDCKLNLYRIFGGQGKTPQRGAGLGSTDRARRSAPFSPPATQRYRWALSGPLHYFPRIFADFV